METYWNDFIRQYFPYLVYRSIHQILEAFRHFANAKEDNDYMDTCNKIMIAENYKEFMGGDMMELKKE